MSLLRLAPLAFLLPAVALAGPADVPDLPQAGDEAPAPIINGDLEGRFPAVVSLGVNFGNPIHACTGTLITDRIVLSAAHCGGDLPAELIVQLGRGFIGEDLQSIEQEFSFIDYVPHPEYRELVNGPGGHPPLADIGIAVTDQAIDVEPIFFNTEELGNAEIGYELLSVGYGTTSAQGGGSGVKRSAEQIIGGYTEDTIRTANNDNPDNGNICSGDSGGPMMDVDDEDNPVIWAVHSYGDQNCAAFSSSTRTDLYVDWILDRVEEVHDSRDLCDINGFYDNGACDEDCAADPECEEPAADDDDDDDDGAAGGGCQSSVAGSGAGAAALLLLPLLALRRRGGSVWTALLVLGLAVGVTAPTVALAAKPGLPTLTDKDKEKIAAGKIVLKKTEDASGVTTVNAVTELAAPASELWPIIFSVDHIKKSTGSIKELVATRDETAANGDRELDLSYVLKVGWTEIKYSVNRSFVVADETMSWVLDKSKDSDIEWTEGSYSVYPGSAPGKTLFLYRARIETGKSIPEWLEEDLTESSLKKYLKYLKETAEKE